MGEPVVCPEFPLLASGGMIRFAKLSAVVVPILAVASAASLSAVGRQTRRSQRTVVKEIINTEYEAPTAAPALPSPTVVFGGLQRGAAAWWCVCTASRAQTGTKSTGSFRRMQLHMRRGSVEPSFRCRPARKWCSFEAARSIQCLFRAGRRFGYHPSVLTWLN